MKRFIPAWYSRNRWWESTSRPFYLKKQYTDFDDMISLMTMHSSNNVDYQLIVLSLVHILEHSSIDMICMKVIIGQCLMRYRALDIKRLKLLIIAIFHGQKALNLFLLPFKFKRLQVITRFLKFTSAKRGT